MNAYTVLTRLCHAYTCVCLCVYFYYCLFLCSSPKCKWRFCSRMSAKFIYMYRRINRKWDDNICCWWSWWKWWWWRHNWLMMFMLCELVLNLACVWMNEKKKLVRMIDWRYTINGVKSNRYENWLKSCCSNDDTHKKAEK